MSGGTSSPPAPLPEGERDSGLRWDGGWGEISLWDKTVREPCLSWHRGLTGIIGPNYDAKPESTEGVVIRGLMKG